MTEKLIAGADESGRGCIIGPLVVVGISVTPEQEKKLKRIGVRDSKDLPHHKREKLAEKIEKIAKDVVVFKVGPCKIDTFKKQGVNLNRVESMKFADIIRMLNPDLAYIDAPDTNVPKFSAFMRKLVGDGVEIVAKHKADRDHPVVSAASIIAKVERENEITKLKDQYGDFGTGYTSDENTINWLREWLKNNKEFPEHLVRRTWITHDVLKGEKEQRSLADWFRGMIGK
ncbi:MAG: ribonuclease HII [Candidatus Aenigmatarchaeota archaeon]|nr:MAG: ribonuclease HII [Candidatus Aenigmarchaeota archaeon]